MEEDVWQERKSNRRKWRGGLPAPSDPGSSDCTILHHWRPLIDLTYRNLSRRENGFLWQGISTILLALRDSTHALPFHFDSDLLSPWSRRTLAHFTLVILLNWNYFRRPPHLHPSPSNHIYFCRRMQPAAKWNATCTLFMRYSRR